MKQRPSSHFFILLILLLLDVLAYVAIQRSGLSRGFSPSIPLAVRDLLLFLPILGIFLWLVRRARYAGDWTLLTLAIMLFGIGQFMQYRLFTDPEYSARASADSRRAWLAKADTIRQQNINQYYDAEKKRALFGDPAYRIPMAEDGRPGDTKLVDQESGSWSTERILTSLSTFIPLLALAGLVAAFLLIRSDKFLILLQRHSLMIGLCTLPFILVATLNSKYGKFFGNTTPWEPVKVIFLVSYAGILTDHYRVLSQTWWGIPPMRFLVPFVLTAFLPIIPFFTLSDFGQLLIFMGAFLTLYLVAVRRIPQLAAAFVLVTIVFGVSILGVGIYKAAVDQDVEAVDKSKWEKVGSVIRRGVPPRIQQRFHLWLQGGAPPDPREVEWWGKIVRDNGLQIGDIDEDKVGKFENEELWYNNYAYQPSQALYGISDGMLLGRGLGRGYPESVPVADSDFIYAAVAEEMGVLGGAVLLVAYLLLMIGGMRTAIEARDMFTKLLAAGITFFLGFQAIVNIGGVVKMLPMTGITLPFVSHGGWSLITSFVMLGMLMAISHRNQTVKL